MPTDACGFSTKRIIIIVFMTSLANRFCRRVVVGVSSFRQDATGPSADIPTSGAVIRSKAFPRVAYTLLSEDTY